MKCNAFTDLSLTLHLEFILTKIILLVNSSSIYKLHHILLMQLFQFFGNGPSIPHIQPFSSPGHCHIYQPAAPPKALRPLLPSRKSILQPGSGKPPRTPCPLAHGRLPPSRPSPARLRLPAGYPILTPVQTPRSAPGAIFCCSKLLGSSLFTNNYSRHLG